MTLPVAPAGYVPFTYGGVFPDIDGTAGTGLVHYAPNGTLITYGNLFLSADPTIANLDIALQACVWLKARVAAPSLPAGVHYAFSSRSVTRTAMPIFVNDAAGTPAPGVGSIAVLNGQIGEQGLDLPHGATLTKCTFGVDPTNTSPPAGVSVLGVVAKRSILTGVGSILVSTMDPTLSTAYGAAHSFDTAAMTEVIDRTAYTYVAILTGETGSGSNDCRWYGASWTATVANVDDGAA